MLNALLIDASDSVPTGRPSQFWIAGADLMTLVAHSLTSLSTASNAVPGHGTVGQPWVLDGNALTWLDMAKKLHNYTGKTTYFYICGRIVKKLPGYYVVDAGGVDGGQAWNQLAHWSYRERKWLWDDFDRGGPSYRNFANYMDSIRKRGTSEEVWSAGKAKKLRGVLANEAGMADKYSKKGDWTTGQVLPALAATLFLAEPGRNLRSFLSNRILLDLMEAGMTYGGRKPTSVPKLYTWNKALLGDSNDQLRGGKSSAANAGSADAGRGVPAPNVGAPGTGNYSQAKEVTLLCRYLTTGRFEGTDESKIDKRATSQITITGNPPLTTDGDLSTPTKIAGYLKYLLQFSVKDWRL